MSRRPVAGGPAAAVLRRATRRLLAAHGPLPPPRRGDPLDQLVATILSQHTSDANSSRAYAGLRAAFGGWSAVAAAPLAEIERAIRCGGLAAAKARSIRGSLRLLAPPGGGRPDLGRLRRMDDGEALAFLTRLPGVGVKTASCVLLFALGRPVFPVDTHVHRVARRLGWFAPRATPDEVGAALSRRTPPGLVHPLHMALVRLGRRCCRARAPDCPACPLRRGCRSRLPAVRGRTLTRSPPSAARRATP